MASLVWGGGCLVIWVVGSWRMRNIRLKFGYALSSSSSCYFCIARKRSLLSERYSAPPRRSAFANYVCIALAGSVGSLVLSVHRKNRLRRGRTRPARDSWSRKSFKRMMCV